MLRTHLLTAQCWILGEITFVWRSLASDNSAVFSSGEKKQEKEKPCIASPQTHQTPSFFSVDNHINHISPPDHACIASITHRISVHLLVQRYQAACVPRLNLGRLIDLCLSEPDFHVPIKKNKNPNPVEISADAEKRERGTVHSSPAFFLSLCAFCRRFGYTVRVWRILWLVRISHCPNKHKSHRQHARQSNGKQVRMAAWEENTARLRLHVIES